VNLSAEKRKISRMQVDLSACIVWGVANNQSDVKIQDMSIHGISFHARKYFTRGTRFNLILPNQKKGPGTNNIQAEVVRCKTLNGFSSAGDYEVGAKFSFSARRKANSKVEPITEALLPLSPIDPENSLPDSYDDKLQNYPMPANAIGALGSSAVEISTLKVNAEFIRSVRTSTHEETVITRIQIKQARLISSPSLSSTRLTPSHRDNSEKLLSPKIFNKENLFLKPR
jgi:hypothetical protein